MTAPRWPWRTLYGSALALMACLFISGVTVADPDGDAKGKGKGKKGKGKAEVVEVDLSKLPPGLANALREHLQAPLVDPKAALPDKKGKDKGKDKKDKGKDKMAKPISLIDAIRIAEKQGGGEAVKADRKSKDGVTRFNIELLTRAGDKTRVALDDRGNPIADPKADFGKGKNKGPDKGPKKGPK